jgi:hypothetical protein
LISEPGGFEPWGFGREIVESQPVETKQERNQQIGQERRGASWVMIVAHDIDDTRSRYDA